MPRLLQFHMTLDYFEFWIITSKVLTSIAEVALKVAFWYCKITKYIDHIIALARQRKLKEKLINEL